MSFDSTKRRVAALDLLLLKEGANWCQEALLSKHCLKTGINQILKFNAVVARNQLPQLLLSNHETVAWDANECRLALEKIQTRLSAIACKLYGLPAALDTIVVDAVRDFGWSVLQRDVSIDKACPPTYPLGSPSRQLSSPRQMSSPGKSAGLSRLGAQEAEPLDDALRNPATAPTLASCRSALSRHLQVFTKEYSLYQDAVAFLISLLDEYLERSTPGDDETHRPDKLDSMTRLEIQLTVKQGLVLTSMFEGVFVNSNTKFSLFDSTVH
ncbi:hypothetical protein HDU91_006271 [Kappamyces sp. JEL0680]|nr:hypothetical protein HDU91_006271 [Kappamyces sp. JEL0680]